MSSSASSTGQGAGVAGALDAVEVACRPSRPSSCAFVSVSVRSGVDAVRGFSVWISAPLDKRRSQRRVGVGEPPVDDHVLPGGPRAR